MKKSTIIALLMFVATIGMAQITKQQAIDYVMDSIVGNRTDSVNVYMDSLVQTSAYYNLSPYDSIQSPYSNYWLFFIDEQPNYSWGHECNYVFINQTNGNDTIVQKQLPPFLYEEKLQEISISFSITLPIPDFSIPGPNYSEENDNCNLYAVLLQNYHGNRWWNNISHMFCALRERGYPEDNIYVLSNDGTLATNISLDLDQDGTDDILNKELSIANLEDIFEELEEIMGPDDMLFVFTKVQFKKDVPNVEGEVKLVLWEQELLDDEAFAAMIEPINCSRMIFSFANGSSGGMADDIENMNNTARKTVLTAINWERVRYYYGWFGNLTGMTEYNFFLISALRGYYPDYRSNAPWVPWKAIGEHPDFSELFSEDEVEEINFDDLSNGGNGDGIQQINETIEYVKEFDCKWPNDDESQFKKYGTKTYNNAFATEDLLSLHGISGKVETTQTLSGSFIIGGQLSIETGVELTLDNTTKFNVFKSEIVIKPGINDENENTPGGKLIANGATFTNACTSPWKGIHVSGNADHQFTYPGHAQAMGRLILDEATIENAEIAVNNYAVQVNEGSGGIINANGSTFKNNKIAVKFIAFSNIYPRGSGKEYDYISSFNNCSYVIDGDYEDENGYNDVQIEFTGVRGIKIKGCSFFNELETAPSGRAIHAINTGFNLNEGCVDPDIQPCVSVNSSFNGFKHAIEATYTEGPSKHISIRNSDFENNGVGINLNAVNYAVIVDNNFDLGWTAGCVNDAGTGIYLDNSHSFAIENNTFEVTNPISGKEYVGIHTNNTNNAGDEIYKNTFDDLVYANYAEGKNWNEFNWKGLAYYCNTNSGNELDFYVHDDDGSGLLGIQLFQGSQNRVTGNIFSSTATWHFNNRGAYEIEYYYNILSDPETPDKLYRVEPKPIQLSKTCPNHYGGGNEVKLSAAAYTQRETDYTSAFNSYNTALSNYNATSDTVYLEQMSHYNMLLSQAAYDIVRSNLSDTVAHDSLFVLWQEKLSTYTSAENMVDYYIQKGDYVTAMNKVDSLPVIFTLYAYDSSEYQYYSNLKGMQTTWLDSGRDIFTLYATEINTLQSIADSSRGAAGAQARGILNFALDTTYFYSNCVAVPDTAQKSSQKNTGPGKESSALKINISPNPARNSFKIEYSLDAGTGITVLQLFNQNGILIDEITLDQEKQFLHYDCSGIVPGIYFYSIRTKKSRKYGKIIIAN